MPMLPPAVASKCLVPALAAALLLSACSPQGQGGGSTSTYTVRSERVVDAIEEIGIVEATRVVAITAPFRGRLVQIPETGTMVRVGDPVVVLEDEGDLQRLEDRLNHLKSVRSELESSVQSLRIALRENALDLDSAEAQLSLDRVRLEDVNNRLAETEILLSREVVPADDLRGALHSATNRRLNTFNTELRLRSEVLSKQQSQTQSVLDIERRLLQGAQARWQLEQARERVESATVTAPVNGMFIRTRSWNWRERAMVESRPGDDVRNRQQLGEIPDLDTLVVKTQIPEVDLYRVEPGMPVEVTFDALDGLQVTGTLRTIGRVAIEREASPGGTLMQTDGFSGQKVFEAIVELAEVDERIRPGLSSQVRIIVEEQEDVLAVPVTAILRREGENLVRVRTSDGRTEDRAVQLAGRRGDRIVVIQGLNPGEVVLSNPTRG